MRDPPLKHKTTQCFLKAAFACLLTTSYKEANCNSDGSHRAGQAQFEGFRRKEAIKYPTLQLKAESASAFPACLSAAVL